MFALTRCTVIGDFKPSFLVDAVFTDKNENTTAKTPFLGDTLTPDAVQEQPLVRLAPPEMHSDFKVAYPTNNIIITLTDPDAPSHSDPKWSEICHWIAIGVPVKVDEDSTLGIQGQGVEILQDIVEYKPPGPPPHTGKHRYVLLAFTPRNATTEPLNLSVPSDRQHWGYGSKGHGVKDWAEDNGLLQIGKWDKFRAMNGTVLTVLQLVTTSSPNISRTQAAISPNTSRNLQHHPT